MRVVLYNYNLAIFYFLLTLYKMTTVVLTIDGKEVYNSSSQTTTLDTKTVVSKDEYVLVENPRIKNRYYYISDRDEDNNPIYTEGVYTITSVQEGPQFYTDYRMIDNIKIGDKPLYKKKEKGGKKSRKKLRRPRRSFFRRRF
jgi:hypothetical protein